ncbi:MAG TPA: 30S ribosomal protein S2, partial [Thermoleophilia bacterium]|nr:30S ribosomal protein S2 [Thermoleophilia bacterium]
CDPDEVDFIIPGNDDAIRSCGLIISTLARAVEEGRQKVTAREFTAAVAAPVVVETPQAEAPVAEAPVAEATAEELPVEELPVEELPAEEAAADVAVEESDETTAAEAVEETE